MTLAAVAGAERIRDLGTLLESCPVDDLVADFASWGFYQPQPWRNYWHTHSFFEVCLAYSGTGRFSCGEVHHQVRAGDIFIARPGEVHEIESSNDEPLGIAFWGFTLRTDSADGDPTEPGWWSPLISGPVVSQRIGNLTSVISALADEVRHPRAGFAALCQALGAAVVVDTARAFASEQDLLAQPPVKDRGSHIVAVMQRHLVDNLSRNVTVRDIAAVVHLSERHAERLFAEQTGSSLMSTLRQLRLDLAGQLLLDTEKSVHEVGRACGYDDVSAFRSAFRRHHGQPPQAFRVNQGTLQLTHKGLPSSGPTAE